MTNTVAPSFKRDVHGITECLHWIWVYLLSFVVHDLAKSYSVAIDCVGVDF